MKEYKFLIIEDEQATRELLSVLINKHFKAQLRVAENGKVGLEVMKEFIPDIILLDLSMPVMDGKETLRHIRNDLFLKNIPVVVLTAHGDKETVQDLIENGVSEYVLKPIEFDITIQRIKNVLGSVYSKDKQNTVTKTINPNSNQILLVTKDYEFISFVKKSISKEFVVHSAHSGTEGFDKFNTNRPHYIIVCDELNILDKKIMTQKVREISDINEVMIFLLLDNNKPLTSTVFNYDGVIKKSFEKETFLKELSKLVPVELTPFEELSHAFEKLVPHIQTSIKKAFSELSGQELSLVEKHELDRNEAKFYITFIFDVGNNIKVIYSIFSTENNIVSIANRIGTKLGDNSIAADERFKQIAAALAEEIEKSMHLNEIELFRKSQSEITSEPSMADGKWNYEMVFKTIDNESFINKFSILANSTLLK
jgi:DNA-binding response OmpR family regulator